MVFQKRIKRTNIKNLLLKIEVKLPNRKLKTSNQTTLVLTIFLPKIIKNLSEPIRGLIFVLIRNLSMKLLIQCGKVLDYSCIFLYELPLWACYAPSLLKWARCLFSFYFHFTVRSVVETIWHQPLIKRVKLLSDQRIGLLLEGIEYSKKILITVAKFLALIWLFFTQNYTS